MVNIRRNGQLNPIEHRDGGRERPTEKPNGQATALSQVVVDLQGTLTKLLAKDDSETARIELARITDIRHAIIAMMQALMRIEERVAKSESMVHEVHDVIKNQRPTKEWYTVTELAQLLGKAEFTVREWCRLGRVHAEKRECGRGNSQEWIVSHAEMTRIQNHGLLPD